MGLVEVYLRTCGNRNSSQLLNCKSAPDRRSEHVPWLLVEIKTWLLAFFTLAISNARGAASHFFVVLWFVV